ncbi:MAG: aminodeoxychorismate/anthranilate synthase component II [Actinomycetia bacterium]|nr:aminodeoxychorismate/anthranilate synthase component II [Actinomycetes bacterium]
MMMTMTRERIRSDQTYAHAQESVGYPAPGLSDVRVLVIDNYDSFTYNLVQYLAEISGTKVRVFRNDQISVTGILEEQPTHVVVSPGPCTPDEAGVSVEAVRALAGRVPVLGVCLGHQSIGQAFGARVVRGDAPVHGKTSLIHHDRRTIFAGLPQPFVATRYHSLVVDRSLPPVLEVSAWTQEGVIMGLRHREFAVEGVQFHPESLLTVVGKDLLRNFLSHRRALR